MVETVAAAQDMSLFSLFLRADLVVKLVMFLLLIASIFCWGVIIQKYQLLKRLKYETDIFEEKFWSGHSLEQLMQECGPNPQNPMSAIFSAGMKEWQYSNQLSKQNKKEPVIGMMDRIERMMNVVLVRDVSNIQQYLSFLATVASNAVFVGLFGTVWGIMSSFQSIAVSQNTSLVVVAPGIAEALLATAMALVAAVPAAIFYNKYSSDFAKYADRLESFSSEFLNVISRHVEEGQK